MEFRKLTKTDEIALRANNDYDIWWQFRSFFHPKRKAFRAENMTVEFIIICFHYRMHVFSQKCAILAFLFHADRAHINICWNYEKKHFVGCYSQKIDVVREKILFNISDFNEIFSWLTKCGHHSFVSFFEGIIKI